jgi:uncharacterized tellurite resistance protein B-like protein
MDDEKFRVELLKLLLHVAYADDHIHHVEFDIILGLARQWKVGENMIAELLASLVTRVLRMPPDLDLLRKRPQDILEAIHLLALADGRVAKDEQSMIDAISEILGTKLAPERRHSK